MKYRVFAALLILTPVTAATAAGEDSSRPLLVWSNTMGLVPALGCKTLPSDRVPVEVRDELGRFRELIASGQNSSPSENSSASDLANFVFEVKEVSAPHAKTAERWGIPLRGSFWQAAIENERYVTITCGREGKTQQNFVVFDVFVPGRDERAAQIGLRPEEMDLLQTSEIHTPDEAESAIRALTPAPVSLSRSLRDLTSRQSPETSREKAARPGSPLAPITESARVAARAVPLANPSPMEVDEAKSTATAPKANNDDGPSALASEDFDPVICSSDSNIHVYDMKLEKILFHAKPLEEVRLVQSFGTDTVMKTIQGKKRRFIRAQFTARPEGKNSGFIQDDVLKQRSSCALAAAKVRRTPQKTKPRAEKTVSGFNFPMIARPVRSYRENPRRFRSGRAGGRLHAASDLYRPVGERVGAIADGQVLRGPYAFYQGVYALEVRHENGWVARYGEVNGRRAPGVSVGDRITKGQTLGYVGWISSRRAQPMLHFELFSGTTNGALTQRWRRGFQRRTDLMDPTPLLTKWEQEKFGAHW